MFSVGFSVTSVGFQWVFCTTKGRLFCLCGHSSPREIIAVAAGGFHSLLLDDSGRCRGYGCNRYGFLGEDSSWGSKVRGRQLFEVAGASESIEQSHGFTWFFPCFFQSNITKHMVCTPKPLFLDREKTWTSLTLFRSMRSPPEALHLHRLWAQPHLGALGRWHSCQRRAEWRWTVWHPRRLAKGDF